MDTVSEKRTELLVFVDTAVYTNIGWPAGYRASRTEMDASSGDTVHEGCVRSDSGVTVENRMLDDGVRPNRRVLAE
jgi:hypothetical protein